MGWRGALYAWESADTVRRRRRKHAIGPDRQVLDILCGKQEQHISADVAYAVWQYWQATGDEGFLLDAGAEILLETGRFWSSPRPAGSGRLPPYPRCHRTVTSITNISTTTPSPTSWHAGIFGGRSMWRHCCVSAGPNGWPDLSSRVRLDNTELQQWSNVAETMATGLDPATGLFEQFAGFFRSRTDRSGGLCRPFRADGRRAGARADKPIPGDQAGRCCRPLGAIAGRVRINDRGGQFPLL